MCAGQGASQGNSKGNRPVAKVGNQACVFVKDEDDDDDQALRGLVSAPPGEIPPTDPVILRKIQKIIGMVLWRCRCDRPDIAFAVSLLSSRMHIWDEFAQRMLAKLCGYLLYSKTSTLEFKIHHKDKWEDLQVCVDWDASLVLPKSQTGYLVYLSSPRGSFAPLSWVSVRQPLASCSSMGAEAIAAWTAIQAAIPASTLLPHDRQKLYARGDNRAANGALKRGWAQGIAYLSRAINLRLATISDLITAKVVDLEWVCSAENRADMFTKALGRLLLGAACAMIGLCLRFTK